MNNITVKQTTQGLIRYLQQQSTAGWDLRCGENSPNLLSGSEYLRNGIVLGYDARTHSREYALRSICLYLTSFRELIGLCTQCADEYPEGD